MENRKTVLITGSNRGIGLDFVRLDRKEYWNVIATTRVVEEVKELQELQPWKILALDVSSEVLIFNLAESLLDITIDLLIIYNAAILYNRGMEESTTDDLMDQFRINAVGPFLLTRALLRNMRLGIQKNGTAKLAQITSKWKSIELNQQSTHYGY
uniref:Short chain dehydrogenase putative n=1 Tax=Albugo laibachii Nc14 TaxID=890382 RepID=F0WJI9_9STRA|nr:short chain dehydrogenase putative [Albugo laibachii Nc14]|eukprot:CCA21438.1 short chain dehydrogenase putative [Albugo laibachii Nc14]